MLQKILALVLLVSHILFVVLAVYCFFLELYGILLLALLFVFCLLVQ